MNETVKIYIWPVGRPGSIYIRHEHDERMPAEGSRREDEGNSCDAHQKPGAWSACRSAYYSSASKQQCYNSHGNRLCQRGTYELTAGNFNYFRC